MYAIRSYYVSFPDNWKVNWKYPESDFKKDSGVDLQKDPLALQRLKDAAEKAKIRITSYNVCYTKLLRIFSMDLFLQSYR